MINLMSCAMSVRFVFVETSKKAADMHAIHMNAPREMACTN
jgi:hypothetical protein